MFSHSDFSSALAVLHGVWLVVAAILSHIVAFGVRHRSHDQHSLPISIGGHGVREGALVTLLSANGVRLELAATLSLLYLLVYLASTVPGGFVELHRHLASPSHVEA